jgi:hypothetical protein
MGFMVLLLAWTLSIQWLLGYTGEVQPHNRNHFQPFLPVYSEIR